MSETALWWLALGGGLVVIIVAVVLLEIFTQQVKRIDDVVVRIWHVGKQVAGNTATTWMLDETSDRLDLLEKEVQRHQQLLRTGSSSPKAAGR